MGGEKRGGRDKVEGMEEEPYTIKCGPCLVDHIQTHSSRSVSGHVCM